MEKVVGKVFAGTWGISLLIAALIFSAN